MLFYRRADIPISSRLVLSPPRLPTSFTLSNICKWACSATHLHMLERVKEVGSLGGLSTSLELWWEYRLRSKTACWNHWPRHTPKLCEHSENRHENQEQKAFSRVIAFIPRQKLCQWKSTLPQGLHITGFLPQEQRTMTSFFYIFAFRDLLRTFLLGRLQKAAESLVLTFFKSVLTPCNLFRIMCLWYFKL